jgi:hypothetical protein
MSFLLDTDTLPKDGPCREATTPLQIPNDFRHL